MLRKTDHRRASMKRSKSDQIQNGNGHQSSGYTSQLIYNNDSRPSRDFNLDDNRNANNNSPNQVRPVPKARKQSIEPGITIHNGGSLEDIGVYVQEEIQPGVILEGYAVDI